MSSITSAPIRSTIELRDRDGRPVVETGEEHGELVAAEPEALAALP